MEQHRKNPACASCHRVIDPLGLALENFDVTGKWRIKDNGVPIDASSQMYDGTQIDGPATLRSALLKHKDAFLLSFTENLMTYALGRRVAAERHAGDPPHHASGGAAGLPDVVVHSGRGAERRVPVEQWGEGRCSLVRSTCPAGPCSRAWASRSRCRCSMRWCRPTAWGSQANRKTPPRRHRDGARRRRQHRDRHPEEHVVAGGRRLGFRSHAERAVSPLEPYRDYLTIVSNTDVRNAEAFTAPEIGGDHFRSAAVFLTQAHPHQTQGSDLRAGISLDQIYAQKVGGETPIPVDAAVHRKRRSGRRLLLRLFVRLHRLDQLGIAVRAAADGARSACRVRSTVRRRRDPGSADGAA